MKHSIVCKVHGCQTLADVAGVCYKHYKQLQRHGKAGSEVSAKLVNGEKLQKHPLYATWRSITRVKLGTQVCEAWRDFEQFIKDVPARPNEKAALRRLNTLKLFEVGNVVWSVSMSPEQAKAVNAERQREYRQANPGYARWKSIKAMYGISEKEYTALFESQQGVCAICGCPETRTTRAGRRMHLHVDHCHTSKKIRGLLCHKCNTALGLFNDNTEVLKSAVQYLEQQ